MPSDEAVAWAKFRVLAVSLCGLTILGVLFYLLTGGSLLAPKASLYLHIPDASGIARKSAVRVDGIDIGKVRSVDLTGSTDPNRIVWVSMTVEAQYVRSIPVDSVVQISADTMLGDRFVDISSGRSGTSVKPDSELRYQPATDFLRTLDMGEFRKRLTAVDAQIGMIERGEGPVGELVQGEAVYNELRDNLARLEQGIQAAVSTTGKVGRVLSDDTVYNRIVTPVRELDLTLARIQSGQGDAGRLMRDTGDYEKLRASLTDFRQMLADLHAGKGEAGRYLTSDAAYVEWNARTAALIRKVDQINAGTWFTTSGDYESLAGAAREMGDTAREFRQNPKKYLRLKIF